jgi:hypothetical protein
MFQLIVAWFVEGRNAQEWSRMLCSPGGSSVGTAYRQLLHSLHHDQRWLTEVNLGKRVGFYRFRGELGSGNFSQVKMAIHQLTKGKAKIHYDLP